MMKISHTACFASSTPLSRDASISVHRHGALVCTLAPERVTKEEKTPLFRVLAPNTPESARPPPVPRHKSLPYVGFYVDRLLKRPALPYELTSMHGPMFSSNFFQIDQTFVCDYPTIMAIMRKPELFTNVDAFPALESFIPNSLISIDGPSHAQARGLLTPAFSPALFSLYFSFISSRARSTWAKVSETTARGERVKLDPVFRKHYLSLTIEMTTGVNMEGEKAARIFELFGKLQIGFFTYRMGPISKPFINARDELLALLCDIVRENLVKRRDVIERLRSYGDDVTKMGAKGIRKGDVDVMLVAIATSDISTEPGAVLDKQVVESLAYSIMLLWLAGYMTSAATSTSASLELGFDAKIWDRLVAEQNELIEQAGGMRDVTYDQVSSQMPLLDAYLLEILRLRPSVTGMARVATQDVEILGNFVPKGTRLQCNFEAAHRDPNFYPQPDRLILERFLSSPKPPPVLSFGTPGSAHYCIGAYFAKTMMKTTFATLFREYKHLVVDPQQSRDYRYVPELAPKSGCVVSELKSR